MTTNIILECRQSDTKSVTRNGVYESYLADDVIINEGDILQLKSAFIDTKKEGDINIENDLILTINYGVYFTDWIEDPTNKKEYVNASGADIFTKTGNDVNIYNFGAVYKSQRFIPYYFISSTGVEYQQVNSVTYKALGETFGEQSPDMPVTYQYVDALTGNTVVIHRTIPASEPNVVYTDVLGFLIKEDSFQILSPSFNDMETDYYWKYISQDITDVPSKGVYSPYIFTKSFTLPAGNYSPSNLSLLISKLMSDNTIDNTTSTISNGSFVKYVTQFSPGAPYPNGATGNISTDGTYFFSDDMTTRFRFGASAPSVAGCPNYLIGATQTALEFDPDSNTFNWAYLHTPIYDGTNGNTISCRIANIGQWTSNSAPYATNKYIKTSENSGIFFTGLSAKLASDNQPFDFWAGVLGFNVDKICAEPRPPTTTTGTNTYFGLTGIFYSYVLSPAINITSGYSGIDNSIIKASGAWYLLASIPVPGVLGTTNNIRQQPAIFSTIDTTTALIADTPYTELLDSFSHYIVDADLHFTGSFVGKDKYNNIQGTVSKYYAVANYVIGDSDGAIQYIHKGAPLMLKSIKVRILRSDKTDDPNLGKDNTIMFQLIKSNK
jgi:hypothetical protein